ncbi:MAG: 3-hydroxyisobutyrate dehydrogenase-like beta-hydroxyacid dehydrogenase [Paracoccaceae bacterium]|jgi:3-hydroxyisobutyrate dehydrogenase-like beta-hydroxyacid dehydrogenase
MRNDPTIDSPIDLSVDNHRTVSLIGFGEAGQAFAKGWQGDLLGLKIDAFDIKTAADATAKGKWQDYETAGITGQPSSANLLAWADLVVCLVTADQALGAAQDAAKSIRPGAYYFDGNSCAPQTKQTNAAVIETAGGRYVDMAIMAPVFPKLHKVPVLLSGPHAVPAAELLAGLNMSARVEEGDVGRASSIKMIRSIMVKGIEALVAECVLAGRRAGVDDVVLASLEQSHPGFGWTDRAAYNLERMMQHGQRRAAEMREVAQTVDDLGLNNAMSGAIVDWQQLIGDLALDPGENSYETRADAILSALDNQE